MEGNANYRALGFSFMMLGVSLGITFGVTMGWVFAPIGLSFLALGVVFLGMKTDADKGEGEK